MSQSPQKQRRHLKASLNGAPLHPNRPRPVESVSGIHSSTQSPRDLMDSNSFTSSPAKKRSLSSATYNQYSNSYPRQSSYSLSSTSTNAQPTYSQGEFQFNPSQEDTGSGSLFTAQQRLHAQAAAAQVAQERAQDQQDQQDAHPNKKRKGIGGAIIETALSAAIGAGAAAITAYSLWSSWGNRPASNQHEQDQQQSQSHNSQPQASGSGNEKSSLEEQPPPPYQYPFDPKSPSAPLSPSASVGSMNSQRHIYVSRRRRRPAFQSSRSARSIAAEKERARSRNQQHGSPSTTSSVLELDEMEEGEEEEDETFARFQSQMQSLIAEGQAALTSEVNMEGIEDDEEEQRFKKMHSSNSFGNPSSNYGMPGGNLFGFDALSSSSSSSMNQPSSSSSNRFFNQQQHPSSSTSQFNPNFSNPTSSFSPLPEPSKTSQFSSHHHHNNPPPQSSRFSQQAQNPQATFSFRSTTMGVGNSSSSSPFGNPNLNQFGNSNNSFTPVSPSPLGSRETPGAPFVFGASNPNLNSTSNSGPVRNLGGNSPYARRPQGGSNSKSRTRNQQQPRWVG